MVSKLFGLCQGGSWLSELRKIPEVNLRKSTTFSVTFWQKVQKSVTKIWTFEISATFLQKLKIFVNKNTIKMENIKVPPIACPKNTQSLKSHAPEG